MTEWILDSGVSHHITSNLQAMTKLVQLPKIINITIPNGYTVAVREAGTVDLRHGLVLKNMLYSPVFNCNLISVQRLTTDENCIITYGTQFCRIQDLTSKKPIGAGE